MGRLVQTREYERHLNGSSQNQGQNSQILQNNGDRHSNNEQNRQSVQNSSDNRQSYEETWGNFSLTGDRGSEDRNTTNLNPSNQSFEQVWGNFNLSGPDDSSFFSSPQNNSF